MDSCWRKQFEEFIPQTEFANGNLVKMERFGNYVVRQLKLKESEAFSLQLAELAEAYIRGDKSGTDDSAEDIRNLLSSCCHNQMDMTSLSKEMLAELDACIYSYFAFHWNHELIMIKQVLQISDSKKMQRAVFLLTRERRLKEGIRHLTHEYSFRTMVDRFKALKNSKSFGPNEKEVLIPADPESRCPVLLLIGGGMGAGKSTVVKEILKRPFWSKAIENAVIVEADAFKEIDQRAGHSQFEDFHLEETDRLMHKLSTEAASSLLVTALNEGRDVIFDGTMSWEPFVMQTIEMAREIHKKKYCMGPGYKEMGNGQVEEKYWEPLDDAIFQDKRPYKIDLVGVICDAHLAVVRGIRRAILTKRGVPIKGQLQSHRWFAASLEKYCKLVDEARVFCTGKIGQPPELIAYKEGNGKLLKDSESFQLVEGLRSLNPRATSVVELYENGKDGELLNQTFREVVLGPDRESRQGKLLAALQTIPLDSDTVLGSNSSISVSSDNSVES